MKKTAMVLVSVAMMMVAAAANAEVVDFHAMPQLSGDRVEIIFPDGSIQPNGNTLEGLEVIIYDDANKTPPRSISKVWTFFLKNGEGFNFNISGKWNLLTPDTPVGPGLAIACGSDGCKYVRPKQ